MPIRQFSSGAVICLALIILAITPARAGSIEAFAGTVGGTATSCSTFGPPSPISFFGSPGFGIGINGNGISDCGLQGSLVDNIAAFGPVTAANSVNASYSGGNFAGTANAVSNYGVVGASSHGVVTGFTSTEDEAAGAGLWTDTLTINGGTPFTQGSVKYTFTIDGSLNSGSNPPFTSQVLAGLGLQQGSFFQGNIFTSSASSGSTGTILGNTSYPGFTMGSGTVSGSGTFASVPINFIFGVPFTLEVGLYAEAFPATGSTSDANFLATAGLTGIQVLDASGAPLTDFTIVSGSGAQYGASGLISDPAAPEPATVWLAGCCILFGLFVTRRCRA